MKKIIILSILTLSVLTGCDTPTVMKSVNCTLENTNDNIETKIKYTIDYQEDEIKKVRMNYEYKNLNNQITDDTNNDKDGIVDGVLGETLNDIISGMKDVILDVSSIKDRHSVIQNTYNDINGFSVSNTTDVDNNYKATYVIDYDNISDTDLQRLNLSRNLDTLKNSYINQGFTCK